MENPRARSTQKRFVARGMTMTSTGPGVRLGVVVDVLEEGLGCFGEDCGHCDQLFNV
jgi:hypothetical protein